MYSGCGIAGVLRLDHHPTDVPGTDEVQLATQALAHRGPHGHGLFDSTDITLGHRRLSILDPAAPGAQPMTRDHLTLVYNGELYNYRQLRHQLATDFAFSSDTDTEVVLRAWQAWGPAAVDRFRGMYAFALWDAHRRCLHLVRDRIGIKPLYVHQAGGFVAFASEIEALLHIPQVPRQPDLEALYQQLLCSSTLQIDPRRTLVRGVEALPAATHLSIDTTGHRQGHTYWRLPATGPHPTTSRDELAADLRHLVSGAVADALIADVPVAVFLSGGLDSSTLTTLAAHQQPITAVTLTYPEGTGTGEAAEDLRYSRLLANRQPTRIRHHVVTQPAEITLDDIDDVCDLAALGDDPRHLNILANYRSIRTLGGHVVLNGQGADEIMGGYVGRPSFITNLLDVRHPSHTTAARLPASRQAAGLSLAVLAHRQASHEEVRAFYTGLDGPPIERAHRLLFHTQLARVVQFEDFLSMRASVECRPVFLDHRIVEACFTWPFDLHIHRPNRHGKTLLRQAMRDLLPAGLLTRRKQVFPHPDPTQLRQRLAALARTHDTQLRADPLVGHLFDLPPPGQLPTLPPACLWLLLTVWRWHDKLRHPSTARAHGNPTSVAA